jgi:periplasmic divalent cation tolerance protein
MKFITIETTYSKASQAQKLAQILLKEKLAACIQLKTIASIYSWQGNIENSKEILVSIKTRSDLFTKISAIIKKHHPYEIPQITATILEQVSRDYAKWLEENLK